MDLKDTLQFYRKRQGLSQIDLADALEVSRQTVSKWETGAVLPSAENLLALSRLYGVTVDTLLNGETEERAQEPPELISLPAEPPAAPPAPGPAAPRRLKPALQMLAAVFVCDLALFFVDISWFSLSGGFGPSLFAFLLRLSVCCILGAWFARRDRARPVNRRRSRLIAVAALLLGLYVLLMPVPLVWRLYDLVTGGVPFDAYVPSNPVRWFLGWTLFDQYAFFSHACLVVVFQLARLRFSRSKTPPLQPQAAQ